MHSTFAYRWIREVIGEKCPYYAYAVVKDDEQRLLLRVTVALAPSEIKRVGDANCQGARQAGRSAERPPHWIGMDSTRLAVLGVTATSTDAEKLLAQGYCLFILASAPVAVRRQAVATLRQLGHGMTFDLKRGPLIAIPFPHIPNQKFLL